jgi:hypothetical protein
MPENSGLPMKVQYHTGISLALAIALYAAFRSLSLSMAAFITGIFVDIDHSFEYVREYGFRLDPEFFFYTFNNTLYKRVILPFHGWEWVALLAILSVAANYNTITAGMLIGLSSHLICDQFSNGSNKWGYFFFFRLKNRFVTSRIFPGKGLP